MSQAAIRVENVTHDFDTVRALDGLSFEVEAGSIFGFLGPNGAGKTTTIRILLGLLHATSGRSEVMGFDTRKDAGRIRQISGALLEHTGLYEQLSVEDNLEFYGRVWHLPPDARRARARELLQRHGYWERRKERVGNWSKGMKQRVALVRALLHRPKLLFLDEPTAGLDVIAAAAVRDDLGTLAEREGITVFLTTHNMAEAERLCRRVAFVQKGRIIASGHPDELRARGGTRLEVVGSGFSEDLLNELRRHPSVAGVRIENERLVVDMETDIDTSPLVSLLVKGGARVGEVHRGQVSLEETFLDMMGDEA
ncbi:MAG: ABC transporter ATP-binding protein [Planctomycetota bacterium]